MTTWMYSVIWERNGHPEIVEQTYLDEWAAQDHAGLRNHEYGSEGSAYVMKWRAFDAVRLPPVGT